MRKVLLTGGLGFLGSHLINSLNDEYEFTVLDKLTYAANSHKIDPKKIRILVKGDVCDSKAVDECVEFVDEVWHWAAESFVDRSVFKTSEFIMTNIVGTHVIAESCLKHKKPLVLKSSDEVLGSLPLKDKGERFTSDSPIDPKNLYAASKASGELLVKAYMNVHNLPAKIIRCCNVYGPGQHLEKFIPNSIKLALANKPIVLYPDGNQSREWIYIDDYVAGIKTILEKGKWRETYNLSSDDCIRNRSVVECILNYIHNESLNLEDWLYHGLVEFKDLRPSNDPRYHMEDFVVEQELGWEGPKVEFREGIAKTIEWYKEH